MCAAQLAKEKEREREREREVHFVKGIEKRTSQSESKSRRVIKKGQLKDHL